MAADYASAVRNGTMVAGRLHRELDLRSVIERRGGSVDIFAVFQALNVPILIRPLHGLLGAFLSEPSPGVLVTSLRPMSIQRWTAAHELGHYLLKHKPSLDGENVLRRLPFTSPSNAGDLQEDEANAFAIAFLMPRWLMLWHAQRHGWTSEDFRSPDVVYQLSLRIGASYEATCWTLARHRLITNNLARELVKTEPRNLKRRLLGLHKLSDYKGDVWLLTEQDAGTHVDGSHNDHFVLRLREHSGGGYLWDIDELRKCGFLVERNETEAVDQEGVGGEVLRHVIAAPKEARRGSVLLNERRPWAPEPPLATLNLDYDFTGPEQDGLSRAERRKLLEAA